MPRFLEDLLYYNSAVTHAERLLTSAFMSMRRSLEGEKLIFCFHGSRVGPSGASGVKEVLRRETLYCRMNEQCGAPLRDRRLGHERPSKMDVLALV